MTAWPYAYAAILVGALAIWTRLVDLEVPQPYLDEYFHIPQAQRYCSGYFTSWDPKITTPPGLYLIATFFNTLTGCSNTVLRLENAACLIALSLVIYSLLKRDHAIGKSAHVALNIALFPPLFFFSALYYTDVPSTLSVLLFYTTWKLELLQGLGSHTEGAMLFLLGLITLSFRQTNIFWVAIFPAALTIVNNLDAGPDIVSQSMHERKSGFGDGWFSIVKTSWKHKVVYDRSVADATIDDYAKGIVSLATCLFKAATDPASIRQMLAALAPFIGLLVSFVTFVAWNGSVVLGDKRNHVATLHFPQMLYIWPYIVFFSWAALIPRLAGSFVALIDSTPLRNTLPFPLQWKQGAQLPRLKYLAGFTILAAALVRYNTIIHPFTLADNRHYTFYVFRLLMRPPWMRLVVIPVYALCAWLCIQGIAGRGPLPTQNPSTLSASTTTRRRARSGRGNTTTLVLIWLSTSALQLVTAPLVEPRYFILPWILWRLSVADADNNPQAAQQASTKQSPATPRSAASSGSSKELLLWCETAWYLLINAVTGYIFLKWTFTWLSEPTQRQRFMW